MIDVFIENIIKCQPVELQAITKPNYLLKRANVQKLVYIFHRNCKEEEVFFLKT